MIDACLISEPGLDECFWIEGRSVGDLSLGGMRIRDWMESTLEKHGVQIRPCAVGCGLQISLHYFPGDDLLPDLISNFVREGSSSFLPYFCRGIDGFLRPVAWVGSIPAAILQEGREVRETNCIRRLVYPWDLLDWNDAMLNSLQSSYADCTISPCSSIMGTLHMLPGCEILPGVVIEGSVSLGRNSRIGPNCYLRGNVSIGDNCRIGQGVEIKSSILGDDVCIPHLSYVGDSVIGSRTNLAAGTICSNYRHDGGEHRMADACGILRPTGRTKLGAMIGHDVKTGCRTTIYPGRIIAPGKRTLPGDIVIRNLL